LAAWALCHLAGAAAARGDCREAWALYEESLGIFRKLSDRPGIAESLGHLGKVAVSQGDYETARAYYKESLAIFREMEDRRGIARCLQGLARLAVVRGQAARAARLFGAAAALREAMGIQLSISEEAEHERDFSIARSGLGELAFAAAWAEGRAMAVEQVVADALNSVNAFMGPAA
jgi:tetratricopeptide (TPR) repeat protein